MKKEKTAILGFGNPVRADDGVGVYVAQELAQEINNDEVQVFDMGTSAFEVLYKLQGHDQLILVDAVINSGEPEGTLFNLPADAIKAEINDDPMLFLHGLKWDQALSYAKKILGDEYPEKVEVYLIAIDNTAFNVGMSQSVKDGALKLIDIIKKRFN